MALTDAQLQTQQNTGIPTERFDPTFWYQRKLGMRPPDKAIWQTWTPEQQAGWESATGNSWRDFSRAWQQRVRPGGDIANKWRGQEYTLAQANPQNEAEFRAAAARAGLTDQRGGGKARFRELLGIFQGTGLGGGKQVDPTTGRVYDFSTSDQNVVGRPRAMQPWEQASYDQPFQRQMLDRVGIGRWMDWAQQGKAGMDLDPATGQYISNRSATQGQRFDRGGFALDASGQPTGAHAFGVQAQPGPYTEWDWSWLNPYQ